VWQLVKDLRPKTDNSCKLSDWDSAFGKIFMDDVAIAVFGKFGGDEANVDLCFALRVQQSRVFSCSHTAKYVNSQCTHSSNFAWAQWNAAQVSP